MALYYQVINQKFLAGFKYQLTVWTYFFNECYISFLKARRHVKILGVRAVTKSKFQTSDPLVGESYDNLTTDLCITMQLNHIQ